MYEFIEYSKERISVTYLIATSLFPKPASEFIAFAADNAIILLFLAFFVIIAAAFEIFEKSFLYRLIIFYLFVHIICIGIF